MTSKPVIPIVPAATAADACEGADLVVVGEPVTLGEARRAAADKDPWKSRWGKRLIDLSERGAELPRRMPFSIVPSSGWRPSA